MAGQKSNICISCNMVVSSVNGELHIYDHIRWCPALCWQVELTADVTAGWKQRRRTGTETIHRKTQEMLILKDWKLMYCFRKLAVLGFYAIVQLCFSVSTWMVTTKHLLSLSSFKTNIYCVFGFSECQCTFAVFSRWYQRWAPPNNAVEHHI